MIGLVSCSAQKLDRPAAARELYTSQLFRKSLAYLERRCDVVYVLSAKHHLVPLDRTLTPYDEQLGRLDVRERRDWAREVAYELETRHANLRMPLAPLRDEKFVALAGELYLEELVPELCAWHGVRADNIEQPLRGLQIGERLSFLTRELALVEEVASASEVVTIE